MQLEAHFPNGKSAVLGEGGRTLTWHYHGLRGRSISAHAEAPAFSQPVAQQGDVLLQPAGVFGHAQLAAEVQSLLLGALRQAGFQKVGNGGIHGLFPALRAKASLEFVYARQQAS